MSGFINNFYVSRILFIIVIVLVSFAVISTLKNKDNIDLRKELNFKKLNINLLFKVISLSFFIRILVEQIITLIGIEETIVIVPSNFLEIVIEIIVTCIFAPIFEEIIFRFGLYNKLNKKIGYNISMLITSIVFSLVHFYNLDGFIILIVISLTWNYSYYKTENLLYSILLHSIHNIYAIISNFVINNKIYIILCIASLVCYILLSLKTKREK